MMKRPAVKKPKEEAVTKEDAPAPEKKTVKNLPISQSAAENLRFILPDRLPSERPGRWKHPGYGPHH